MNSSLSPDLFVEWAQCELPDSNSSEVMKRANELAEMNRCLDLPFSSSDINSIELRERLNVTEEEHLLNYVVNEFLWTWQPLHIDPLLNQRWRDFDINSMNTYIRALKQVSEYRNTKSLLDLLELDKIKPELLKLIEL